MMRRAPFGPVGPMIIVPRWSWDIVNLNEVLLMEDGSTPIYAEDGETIQTES